MIKEIRTIRDAAMEWVSRMDSIRTTMIEKLASFDPDDWHEITTPSCGDRVYVYELPDGCTEHGGEIANFLRDADVYLVNLDDGAAIEVAIDDFEVERYDAFPMWGTMWSFKESCDDDWLGHGGIELMSRCGFRVYESDEFGYFFGVDGAGYDFYEAHWIPLYKARGLRWHINEE